MSSYLVAITRLATPIEAEAKALAADLGGVPYDHRLKLAAGVPTIVLSTPDGDAANACATRVRARGNGVFICWSEDVLPAQELKFFEQLPFGELTALVRATLRTSTETTQTVKKKEFSAVRAVVTGGLITKKSTTTTSTSHASDIEAVLYVFGRAGTAPWLLREQHARYDALGAAVTPHSLKNFELAIAEIRKRAPQAKYDDRLVARKQAPEEQDLLAYIVATAS